MAKLDPLLLLDFNDQITRERFNYACYRQMAADLSEMNLVGMSEFMQKQSQGELSHAEKLVGYIEYRSAHLTLKAVPAPEVPTEPLAMFQFAYQAELDTTTWLKTLHQRALAMDSQAAIWLESLLSENVEEEKTTELAMDQFKYSTDLLVIDRRIAEIKTN